MFKNVRDYGASGTPARIRTFTLTNLSERWISYPPGTCAQVRFPEEDAVLDSAGIQAAVDAAADEGGGTVVVPPGDYICGPMKLRSGVELKLEPGARIWASPNLGDYMTDAANGLEKEMPGLFSTQGVSDCAITGGGEIHGQSPRWVIPWMNEDPSGWAASLRGKRPGRMIVFEDCSNIRIEDIGMYDAPRWCLVFLRSGRITVRGTEIRGFDVVNSDGIDIVDSQDVVISGCRIHSCDDGICMKSGLSRKPDGKSGVRRVSVSDCIVRSLCNAVTIGTESYGVFEDIAVGNMVLHNLPSDPRGAEGGINVAICDGGAARGIHFHDIVMHGPQCPFYCVVTPRKNKSTYSATEPGIIEDLSICGIQARNTVFTPFIIGCPGHPIRDFRISGVHIIKTGDFYDSPPAAVVPECGQQYPTPFMFGTDVWGKSGLCRDMLPAFGLYMRDACRGCVTDFEVVCEGGTDARDFIVCERSPDVRIRETSSLCRDRFEPPQQ